MLGGEGRRVWLFLARSWNNWVMIALRSCGVVLLVRIGCFQVGVVLFGMATSDVVEIG